MTSLSLLPGRTVAFIAQEEIHGAPLSQLACFYHFSWYLKLPSSRHYSRADPENFVGMRERGVHAHKSMRCFLKGLCTSHLYLRPPPTGIAVGYGAVQVLFDCPRSTGELRGV